MTGAWQIALEPRARKHLAHTDPVSRRRLARAIEALRSEPEPRGCVPLKGMHGVLRIRVGDYRIVYSVDREQRTVVVIDIDHRRDIYR